MVALASGLSGVMARKGLRDLDVLNGLDRLRLGVSAATLGNYKAGRRDPSTAMVVALAQVCGVTTDEILGVLPGEPVPGAVTVPGAGEAE